MLDQNDERVIAQRAPTHGVIHRKAPRRAKKFTNNHTGVSIGLPRKFFPRVRITKIYILPDDIQDRAGMVRRTAPGDADILVAVMWAQLVPLLFDGPGIGASRSGLLAVRAETCLSCRVWFSLCSPGFEVTPLRLEKSCSAPLSRRWSRRPRGAWSAAPGPITASSTRCRTPPGSSSPTTP